MAAVIRIEVVTEGGTKEIKQDIQSLGDTAKNAGSGFSAMREVAVGALRQIGTLGVDLAVKGFQAIGGAISDGIADAKNYAIIAAQTEAVIKSTGGAAGVSAEHIAEYAGALSDAAGKSLFGDDQIQQSTNLLLTFTEIKGTVLDAATAMSVDMAQALGGAPKDAAIQLGKALNDPIKGITALSRVGVSFTEEQKKQIKVMQEAGNMAGAQQVILAELNKEFGGSAQAAADATGGWSEFNGRMGEAKETLGAAVLPLLNSLAGVLNSTVMPVVEGLASSFGDLVQALQRSNEWSSSWLETIGFVIDRVLGLSDAVGPVQGFLSDVADAFRVAGEFTSSFEEQLGATIDTVLGWTDAIGPFQSVGILIADVMTAIQAAIATALADSEGPIHGFLSLLDQISPTFEIIHAIVATVMPSIRMIITDIFGIIGGFLAEHGAKIRADVAGTWEQIQGVIAAVIPPIQKIVNSIFGAIATFLHTHGDDIKAFLAQTWDQIASIVKIAAQLVQAIIVPVFTFIASFLSSHGTQIQALLSNTWNAIKAVIDIALTLIQGVLKAALQIIQGDWSGAWETIKTMSARIVQDLFTILQSGFNNAVTLFGGFVDQAIEVLSKLPGQAMQLGKDVVDGIISGVQSMAGALLDVLANMAADALQSWKDAIFSDSPSKLFADEGGKPIVEGIIQGIQDMIPSLLGVVGGISDDLVSQVNGIADKLSGAMSDALLGTASLDRAKAKAIGALKDITAAQQEEVQKQLVAASDLAVQFGDPKQAAAFFKQRSDQIFELAKLRDQIEKATDEKAKARFIEQFNLIGKAQQNELQALAATGDTGPFGALAVQVQKLLAAPGLPGILDPGGGILGQLVAALPQLVAMSGGNTAPSNVSSLANDNRQFSYTVNTTAAVTPIDYSTARALSGV